MKLNVFNQYYKEYEMMKEISSKFRIKLYKLEQKQSKLRFALVKEMLNDKVSKTDLESEVRCLELLIQVYITIIVDSENRMNEIYELCK